MTWLRCLFLGHEWITWLDTTNPEHVAIGHSWKVCRRCAASHFAPGVLKLDG